MWVVDCHLGGVVALDRAILYTANVSAVDRGRSSLGQNYTVAVILFSYKNIMLFDTVNFERADSKSRMSHAHTYTPRSQNVVSANHLCLEG